jgi:hypothetical protein
MEKERKWLKKRLDDATKIGETKNYAENNVSFTT